MRPAPADAPHLKALREQEVARGLVDGGKERPVQRCLVQHPPVLATRPHQDRKLS